jgi:putative PIN family toxin of toxin-antitoxin system
VLDSGILVSAFLTPKGLAAEVLARSAAQGFLFTAEVILEETRQVLLERDYIRARYVYEDTQVEQFLSHVRTLSSLVSVLPPIQVVARDPKDDAVLACAVGASAAYLVSRDPHLLDLKTHRRIQILPPETFIAVLRALTAPGEATQEG